MNKETLTNAEKMELYAFAHSSTAVALFKLMRILVTEARDQAIEISPSQKAERDAAVDTAYAMNLFSKQLKDKIQEQMNEHRGELQRIENEALLQDQEQVEALILGQQ